VSGLSTLLVFAKPPVPGRVKTRLLGRLTAAEAAALHRACLLDAIRLAAAVPACAPRLLVAPGGHARGADFSLSPRWHMARQRGRGLGERLERAFADAFARGARKVAVIGTDTPWMGPRRIETALAWLDSEDVVLGPSADGGYYLLATRRPLPLLFRGIPWGSAAVLASTRRALERAHVPCRLLPWDFDLDRPADLDRARTLLAPEPSRSPELARWLAEFGGRQP
jgi:rSAM/selenodomain-associated transferase 1